MRIKGYTYGWMARKGAYYRVGKKPGAQKSMTQEKMQ